ncbi:ABC transporter permease [Desulfitobacterium chlororespirans]|uniref:Putative ABC transport system permease protein n=1 Tax=Desulfitobacterium chlororespirans DSM 11544 TaxID=1121395 RepID=A0A1M7S0G1_9FIRM|nr:FtsX-like permease family protein [Desulfitobacterium chlororespirans]SHN51938.1 putative ABC transport system permease protein [Desulfitobacterium chlororespirans DSM 11544]
MTRGLYLRLALTAMAKNRKLYLPYILTCVGMVMMFYIISFLAVNPGVGAMPGGDSLQMILTFGRGVMGIFSVIFLFYTNSFLIRKRKKEFGLYNILGMGKWNLARILTWESIVIGTVSVAGGLFCGILFAKVAELSLAHVLKSAIQSGFSVDWPSLLGAALLFAVIFLLILLNGLRQIHVAKPVELLRSDTVGEKPPKANWALALPGVIILAGAYYLALTIQQPLAAMLWFFVAVVMVIIGTYLLFIAGSVVFCRLLQKNKKYYYKTSHFVSVSSMVYRMKRNGAGLASICILSTMVLVMLSTTVCLYIGAEDSLRSRYPRQVEVELHSIEPAYIAALTGAVDKALEKRGIQPENSLSYRYLGVTGYLEGEQMSFKREQGQTLRNEDSANLRQLLIIPLEDYNRLTGAGETLGQNEILLYSSKGDYAYDRLGVEGAGTLEIKKTVPKFVDNGMDSMQAVSSFFIVVPELASLDAVFEKQKEIYGDRASSLYHYYGFDLNLPEEMQITLREDIAESVSRMQLEDPQFPAASIQAVAQKRADFYALYGGLLFLGVLLGIVFILGAVLIMYYKQISEGYEDQARFDIMQKVGMTRREIRKSINSQVLTVFFLPLAAAGVHITFAFPMISKLMALFSLTNTSLLAAVTVGCYLVFTLFYVLVYVFTSRAYYSIVSGGVDR